MITFMSIDTLFYITFVLNLHQIQTTTHPLVSSYIIEYFKEFCPMKIAAVATALLVGAKAINIDTGRKLENEVHNKLEEMSGTKSLGHHHNPGHHHHFEHRAALNMVYPECVERSVEWGLLPCHGVQTEAACNQCQFGDDIHCMWCEEQNLCIDWSRCIDYNHTASAWEPIKCEDIKRPMQCKEEEHCGCHWVKESRRSGSCQGPQ